jgi:hypothetical protein
VHNSKVSFLLLLVTWCDFWFVLKLELQVEILKLELQVEILKIPLGLVFWGHL